MVEYSNVKRLASHEEVIAAICWVTNSRHYELDDLSHIVLKGTKTRVGYIGDDSLQLCNPRDDSLRIHHRRLEMAFNNTDLLG